jgi:hypothetical protein
MRDASFHKLLLILELAQIDQITGALASALNIRYGIGRNLQQYTDSQRICQSAQHLCGMEQV